MKRLVLPVLALSLFAVGFQSKSAKPTFAKDVQPLIKKNCLACHTGAYAADKVDLSKIKTEADAKKNLKLLKKAWSEVEAGKMPPKGAPKPSAVHKKSFGTWIKAQK